MSAGPIRQHYSVATGKGLEAAPSRKGSPGYAKGGRVTGGVGGVSHKSCPPGFKKMPEKCK